MFKKIFNKAEKDIDNNLDLMENGRAYPRSDLPDKPKQIRNFKILARISIFIIIICVFVCSSIVAMIVVNLNNIKQNKIADKIAQTAPQAKAQAMLTIEKWLGQNP